MSVLVVTYLDRDIACYWKVGRTHSHRHIHGTDSHWSNVERPLVYHILWQVNKSTTQVVTYLDRDTAC